MQFEGRPRLLFLENSCSIATWDGPHVAIHNPAFDFAHLVQESVERDNRQDGGDGEVASIVTLLPMSTPPSSPADQVFSLSPMSSVPASPILRACDPSAAADAISPLDLPTTPASSSAASVSQPTTQPLTGKAKRKARTKARKSEARKVQRIQSRDAVYGGNYQARSTPLKKYVVNAKPIKTKFNIGSIKVASTGYVGLDDGEKSTKRYTLADLVGEGSLGFEYIPWNGTTPTPILAGERLIAILAGKPGGPDDKTWPAMEREATEMLARAQEKFHVPQDELLHRRGKFKTLRGGVSFGSGQTRPANARPSNKTKAHILRELNAGDPFKRLAGFASSVMATWTPDLYHYYSHHLGALFEHDRRLRRNFTTSVFTSNTYNLGPRTVCSKHTDFRNLPFGLCAVTALGSFDPKKGGHLVLWQCKLVIEFPPGSTILLPSAVIAHFNIDIGSNETRYSFTQYASGGLFRWVDYGFQTRKSYYKSMTKDQQRQQDIKNSKRWEFGLSLFPNINTQ